MADTAFNAPDAHIMCRLLTLERTLRMKWTMHRWYLASGSIALTVATSPAHRSPTTSLTPLSPRSLRLLKKPSQLARSFFHALCHTDDLTVARVVHADRD